MRIALFTTHERGPDHGPIYYMALPNGTQSEITREQYLGFLELPGHWADGDYYAETGDNAPRRVVLAYGMQSSTIDHEWHTCPDCLACGGVCEACDYRQTVDDMSYRSQ